MGLTDCWVIRRTIHISYGTLSRFYQTILKTLSRSLVAGRVLLFPCRPFRPRDRQTNEDIMMMTIYLIDINKIIQRASTLPSIEASKMIVYGEGLLIFS
jgi:hypothetical protein